MSNDVLIIRPVSTFRLLTRLPWMWWKLRKSLVGRVPNPGCMAFRIALIHVEIKVRKALRIL